MRRHGTPQRHSPAPTSSVASTFGCSSIVSPPLKWRSSHLVSDRQKAKGPCGAAQCHDCVELLV